MNCSLDLIWNIRLGGVRVAARDLKSLGPKGPCGFESHPRHKHHEDSDEAWVSHISCEVIKDKDVQVFADNRLNDKPILVNAGGNTDASL